MKVLMVLRVDSGCVFKIRMVLTDLLVEGRVSEVVVRVNSASVLRHSMSHHRVLILAMRLIRMVSAVRVVAQILIPAVVAVHRLGMTVGPWTVVAEHRTTIVF